MVWFYKYYGDFWRKERNGMKEVTIKIASHVYRWLSWVCSYESRTVEEFISELANDYYERQTEGEI